MYSVILGQIYTYYFDRQGTIQDRLYAEAYAARDLAETVDAAARAAPRRLRAVSRKPLQLRFNMTLYESMRAMFVSRSRELVQR